MPDAPRPTMLTTDRLVLRPQRESDAEVFRQLWNERDERVPSHRRLSADGRPTVAEIAEGIRQDRAPEQPGLLTVVLRDTDEVIGYCGVVFDGDGERPELAFELLQAAHNRGYATEAGRIVIGWARDHGYPLLWATVWEWNLASRRVLTKLEFADTGVVTKESPHGRSLLMMRDVPA